MVKRTHQDKKPAKTPHTPRKRPCSPVTSAANKSHRVFAPRQTPRNNLAKDAGIIGGLMKMVFLRKVGNTRTQNKEELVHAWNKSTPEQRESFFKYIHTQPPINSLIAFLKDPQSGLENIENYTDHIAICIKDQQKQCAVQATLERRDKADEDAKAMPPPAPRPPATFKTINPLNASSEEKKFIKNSPTEKRKDLAK